VAFASALSSSLSLLSIDAPASIVGDEQQQQPQAQVQVQGAHSPVAGLLDAGSSSSATPLAHRGRIRPARPATGGSTRSQGRVGMALSQLQLLHRSPSHAGSLAAPSLASTLQSSPSQHQHQRQHNQQRSPQQQQQQQSRRQLQRPQSSRSATASPLLRGSNLHDGGADFYRSPSTSSSMFSPLTCPPQLASPAAGDELTRFVEQSPRTSGADTARPRDATETFIPAPYHIYVSDPAPPNGDAARKHAVFDRAKHTWRYRLWPAYVDVPTRLDFRKLAIWCVVARADAGFCEPVWRSSLSLSLSLSL
jgi:hypothetical protein